MIRRAIDSTAIDTSRDALDDEIQLCGLSFARARALNYNRPAVAGTRLCLRTKDEYRYYRNTSRIEYEWSEEGGGLENEERAKIMRTRRDGHCAISPLLILRNRNCRARDYEGYTREETTGGEKKERLGAREKRERVLRYYPKEIIKKKTPTFITRKSVAQRARARDTVNIASKPARGFCTFLEERVRALGSTIDDRRSAGFDQRKTPGSDHRT